MPTTNSWNPGYANPRKKKTTETLLYKEQEQPDVNQTTSTSPSPVPQGQTNPSSYDLIQPRQWSADTQSIVDQLKGIINQAPVTARDVMNSPEYQDLASGIQYQADKAQAGMYKDFASRGAFGSKQAGNANAEMRGAYQAQLAGLVPQLIQAETARRQQQIANVSGLLNAVSGLENTAFNQGVTTFNTTAPYTRKTTAQQTQEDQFTKNYALNEAGITGRYMNPDVREQLNTLIQATQSYSDPNDGTTPEQDNATANAVRTALRSRGYDVSGLGADKTLDQKLNYIASGAFSMPTTAERQAQATMFGTYNGQPTLQGQQAQQQLASGQQALDMGKLQYGVAANPEYGLAAQARQGIQQGALDMENTRSAIGARAAQTASAARAASQPTDAESYRDYITQNYGISPGMTTNYELFARWVDTINQGALAGATIDDFYQEFRDQEASLRTMGVDTAPLREYAEKVFPRVWYTHGR